MSSKSTEKQGSTDALAVENEQLKDEMAKLKTEKAKIELYAQAEIDSLKAEKKQIEQDAQDTDLKARQPLADALSVDSKGYFSKDDLAKLRLGDLMILRRTFNSTVARDYEDFLEKREQKRQAAKRRFGTVGSYNQDTKEFEDGV